MKKKFAIILAIVLALVPAVYFSLNSTPTLADTSYQDEYTPDNHTDYPVYTPDNYTDYPVYPPANYEIVTDETTTDDELVTWDNFRQPWCDTNTTGWTRECLERSNDVTTAFRHAGTCDIKLIEDITAFFEKHPNIIQMIQSRAINGTQRSFYAVNFDVGVTVFRDHLAQQIIFYQLQQGLPFPTGIFIGSDPFTECGTFIGSDSFIQN
jgi:hypothetical protein